jgi:hypothetical protein
MPSPRRFPRPATEEAGEAFASTAEAWLWAAKHVLMRAEGAKAQGISGSVARPCEPGDVVLAARRQHRAGWLGKRELRVLWHYGTLGREPWDDSPFEREDWRAWSNALARLEPPLIRRGIVVPPHPGRFGHVR